LNQLYSLKYGTIPIVRATGGLADTVVDANEQSIADGTATGFAFDDYDSYALENTLHRACRTYCDSPDIWSGIVETGMRNDWSSAATAKRYLELYGEITQRIANPAFSH
jgi:starch synthase